MKSKLEAYVTVGIRLLAVVKGLVKFTSEGKA